MEQDQIASLQPIANRAHQVMIELYVMQLDVDTVCMRHGLTPSEARELALQGFNDALVSRTYGEVIAGALVDLHEARNELWKLYKELPNDAVRWHEEMDRDGNILRFDEQVNNVPLKAKLLAEVRQNAQATKVITVVDSGIPTSPGSEMGEIMSAVVSAVAEAVRQEESRQEAINITPEPEPEKE